MNEVSVCGEIEYSGRQHGAVHSDICLVHNGEYSVDPEERKFLHQCLDEWIDKSQGTGMFWIGDPQSLADKGMAQA
jgi:hypothetical protein